LHAKASGGVMNAFPDYGSSVDKCLGRNPEGLRVVKVYPDRV